MPPFAARIARAIGALALCAAACGSQETFKLCNIGGTSYLCPESLECGGSTATCVTDACGNGVVDLGEQCDDGNAVAGDGCSPHCQREECGNAVLDPGEQCDDGNLNSGDGCSASCKLERCGNGTVEAGEDCDDGNTVAGDGCSPHCLIE
jgi:cysteine-rich repeat protein